MDMFNWLGDCMADGSLTMIDIDRVIDSDLAAQRLWEEYAADSQEFVGFVRDEVRSYVWWHALKDKK